MHIQEALGDIGLPKIAELASEAPTLAGDDIVAACIHEAEEPPGMVGQGNESVKILAVRSDGTLLLISWTRSDYTVERFPPRNIARVSIAGTQRFDVAWTRLLLEIDLRGHEGQDDAKLEFRPISIEDLGENLYRTEKDAAAALMKVAEACRSDSRPAGQRRAASPHRPSNIEWGGATEQERQGAAEVATALGDALNL